MQVRAVLRWNVRRTGSRLAILSGLAVMATLAACGGGASAPKTAAAQPVVQASASVPAPPPAPKHLPVLVRTATSRYGRILVDTRGRTLYLFTRDRGAASTCSGACARAWPPYIVAGPGLAGGGARSSRVGVIRRSGGARQVTYNGHPLYHYIGDRAPGVVLCQDVEEYGGHWWVVSPAGGAITAAG
jgi:predicted lipoprotein with Yx(FWY)xxD motif